MKKNLRIDDLCQDLKNKTAKEVNRVKTPPDVNIRTSKIYNN